MKPLTWKEHQTMDALKVKVQHGTITPKERVTLDKLTTRWKVVGDVMPDVFKGLFNF